MLDFNKYKVTIEDPKKPHQPKLDTSTPTKSNALDYVEALKEYEAELEEYKLKDAAYSNAKYEAEEKFYDDALEEVGLTGHPRASKAFYYAYERGHSGGLEEVLNVLRGIAEVLVGD